MSWMGLNSVSSRRSGYCRIPVSLLVLLHVTSLHHSFLFNFEGFALASKAEMKCHSACYRL